MWHQISRGGKAFLLPWREEGRVGGGADSRRGGAGLRLLRVDLELLVGADLRLLAGADLRLRPDLEFLLLLLDIGRSIASSI